MSVLEIFHVFLTAALAGLAAYYRHEEKAYFFTPLAIVSLLALAYWVTLEFWDQLTAPLW